jgi:hypothetical protein
MTFNDFIAQLALELKLPELVPDPDGSCAVVLDGVYVGLIPYDGGQAFTARAQIGNLRGHDFSAMAGALLAANRLTDDIGGSMLAMDAGADVYITQRFACDGQHFDHFAQALSRYVVRARHWQDRLGARAPAASAPADMEQLA